MNKYKTIDLFAGIGGIRRGFEKTNHFKNILSAEIDKYACITYEHLYGENPYNDVTSEEFKKKIEAIEYDVLLAGFPCQSFSIAGKKEGFKDKIRGTLFFDIAEIIVRTKPKAFLLENVEGLTTHNKGKTLNVILEILCFELGYEIIGVEKIGSALKYSASSFVRNCKDFGIPQKRPRTYIMGFNKRFIKDKGLLKELPKDRKDLNMYKDLNDLLEFGNEEKFYVAEGYLKTLKNHRKKHENKGNGFGYLVVNGSEIKQPIANTILATGGSGKERNLVYDPNPDIAGKKIKTKKTKLNSEGIRHMTPREWGKLQGFINYAFVDKNGIDHFKFPMNISNAQLYKQFGNSVSIPVIESMAKHMYEILKNIELKG
ncbi:MAG: DNA (cytosine-5-)-methyltransferase [Fusobacteriaceae bacterium]